MTRQKTFKRQVRGRMAKTGESYTAAHHQLTERADCRQPPSATPVEMPTSNAALEGATGRGWDEWLAILDEWPATEHDHPEIVRWLTSEHGVGGWWAQSVTVGYERARGRRTKYQTSAGFAAGVSRTISASPARLYESFVEPGMRARWLGDAELNLRTGQPGRSARFDWPADGSRVIAGFNETSPGKVQVSVQHEKLADAAAVERQKAFWRERLGSLKSLLEA